MIKIGKSASRHATGAASTTRGDVNFVGNRHLEDCVRYTSGKLKARNKLLSWVVVGLETACRFGQKSDGWTFIWMIIGKTIKRGHGIHAVGRKGTPRALLTRNKATNETCRLKTRAGSRWRASSRSYTLTSVGQLGYTHSRSAVT